MIGNIDSVLELARPAIRRMKPYSSARSLVANVAPGTIFLDANENPWGRFNRYPDPQPERLIQRLGKLYDVRSEELMAVRGTDDAIDALIRTFCEAGRDRILVCPPTYGVYEISAEVQGAGVVSLPQSEANGFAIDPDALLEAWTPEVKLVFLCSPNNPTGNCVSENTLERIARGLAGRAVVVVDEAYVEFTRKPSLTQKMGEHANVVVLRTLSKAWGMAGARCGVALARPEIIALLQKVRAPYPISTPSILSVLEALDPSRESEVARQIDNLCLAREELRKALARLPFVERVFPSEANFILFRVKNAHAVVEHCRRRGIIVRDRSYDRGLENCVRVSVGASDENQLLLQTLREMPNGD